MRTRRLSPAQALAVARERILWNRRADTWDDQGSAGLHKVVEAVLEACAMPGAEMAVDLGAGSGQITLPLARSFQRVLAVDVSASLIERLQEKAQAEGVGNIDTLTNSIEGLNLPAGSVDLVVSNYALHHLRDHDKAELLRRSYDWLRPGGRIVIGDMMFGRGAVAEDRDVIATKVRGMVTRGPAGWWRLAKNVFRFGLRVGEKPLPSARWESMAHDAGFADIATNRIVSEACVLSATKPLRAGDSAETQLIALR